MNRKSRILLTQHVHEKIPPWTANGSMVSRDFFHCTPEDMNIKPLTHDLNTLTPIDGAVEAEYRPYHPGGQCYVTVSTTDTTFDGFADSLEHALAYLAHVYPHLTPVNRDKKDYR